MLPAPLEESGSTSRLLRRRNSLWAGLVVAACTIGLAACGGGDSGDSDEPEGEFPVEVTTAEFPARQSLAEAANLVLSVENTGDETIPNLAVTIFTIANPDADVVADPDAADPSNGANSEAQAQELADEVDQQLQEELEQSADDESGDEESATETSTEEQEFPVADGPFAVLSDQPGLASASRPVWTLEQGYPTLLGEGIPPGPPGELAAGSGAVTASTNTFSWGELEPGESISMVWRVTPVKAGDYTVHYRVAAGVEGNAVAVTDDGQVPEGTFFVNVTDAPPLTEVNEKGKVVPVDPTDLIDKADAQAATADSSSTP